MRTIARLEVSGFKSIRHLELDLRPLNVLIGPNGAGKSNFLSLFRLIRAVTRGGGGLDDYTEQQGGANSVLYYGAKRTPRLHIKLTLPREDGASEWTLGLRATAHDNLVTDPEPTLVFEGREVTTTEVGMAALVRAGHPGTMDSQTKDTLHRQMMAFTIQTFDFRAHHFHNTSSDATFKKPCSVLDYRSLDEDGGNLAAVLFHLSQHQRAHYDAIRDAIRMVAPFFDDFSLEPSKSGQILLEWRDRTGAFMKAGQLSDGTLSFICLATLLLQPKPPALVLIDEPELGLHPYALGLLAGMLRSASERSQVIVSTQSVTLLDQLDEPEDVVVVERKEDQTALTRLDPAALELWLQEYSLGELWQKNVLGGRP